MVDISLFHGHPSFTKQVHENPVMFVMLSIISLTPSIAASAAPPCSTATMGVSLGVRSDRGKFLSRKNLAQVVVATLT
jgi:hypothetical protein